MTGTARGTRLLDSLILLALAILAWQAAFEYAGESAITPPLRTVEYLASFVLTGNFWGHAVATIAAFVYALAIASALGVVFSLVTAATGGFDFLARWLVGAYVIVAVLYVVGLVVGLPYYRNASRALATDGDAATARRVLDDPRGWGSLAISAVGYVAIIFLMVVKPAA